MKRNVREIRITKYRRKLLGQQTEWTRNSRGVHEPWGSFLGSGKHVNDLRVRWYSLAERGKGGVRRFGKLFYQLNHAWSDSCVLKRTSRANLRTWNAKVLQEHIQDWWENQDS